MRTVTIEKDGNNYTVNPNASSGSSLSLNEYMIEGLESTYGYSILLDENFNSIHIDDVTTKSDWSDVCYIITHTEYSDRFDVRIGSPLPVGINSASFYFDNLYYDLDSNSVYVENSSTPSSYENVYINSNTATEPITCIQAIFARLY